MAGGSERRLTGANNAEWIVAEQVLSPQGNDATSPVALGPGSRSTIKPKHRWMPRIVSLRFTWSSLVHEGRRAGYLAALGIPAPRSRASARRVLRAQVLETARDNPPGGTGASTAS